MTFFGTLYETFAFPVFLLANCLVALAVWYAVTTVAKLWWPGLWDVAPIVAGIVAGVAFVPQQLGVLAAEAARPVVGLGPDGVFVTAVYRSGLWAISVASCLILLNIGGEAEGYLEPPPELAPVADRFRGTTYAADLEDPRDA